MTEKFITLEGIEGSGKSTSLKIINNYLDELGFLFINTREPGGGPIGPKLRSLLLDTDTSISPEVEMMLMLADRKDHVDNIILPNLKQNKWVISDRYMDSTIAYQGGGRRINLKNILSVEKLLDLPVPSLTLLFDLPVEMALERAIDRGELDRFEREPIEFHNRVRDTYLKLSRQHPERIFIIDSSKDRGQVESQLLNILKQYFEDHV